MENVNWIFVIIFFITNWLIIPAFIKSFKKESRFMYGFFTGLIGIFAYILLEIILTKYVYLRL